MSKLDLANWTGPGAEEFARLPPDADLLAEWERHDRRRNAGRHPGQPVYDEQYAAPAVAERRRDET